MTMADSVKNILSRIGGCNRPLADELAKLPELGKFKTDSSRLALATLCRIYRFAPRRFDRVFSHMNAIGLPESRRYCTPLQALLWMLQDNKLRRSGRLLGLRIDDTGDDNGRLRPSPAASQHISLAGNNATGNGPAYTLIKILDAAWNGETALMSGTTIHGIINRIRDDEEEENYALLVKRRSDAQLQSYIMEDYLKKRQMFHEADWPIIETAIDRSRWKQFYTVADRLNSPALVSYYIDNYFSFRKTPASGVYFTFFESKAQCTDAAYFAQFMLRRAGYRTFMRSVKWSEDPWDGLHTGSGVILDDGGYLLVSNYTGINGISGPYHTVEDLDEKLACDRTLIGRKWGAYYPPRYY